ncbi:MAG: 8-oxo-dGTP diphosphatase [Halobacteriales archaeon]|nr:8-oxo-dGTP diphosphatase [Halobacteriales archaeon]
MDFAGTQEATICHLLEGDLGAGPAGIDRVLLMRKKRGVGAGLYNGPGGKVEPGETPAECAVREAREELRVDVRSLEKVGELKFAFGGEPTFFCHVFRSADFAGPARETPEADPSWFPVDDLPYDEMWEDDREWFPHLLEGRPFRGLVAFDAAGEVMTACELETDVELASPDTRSP